MAGLILVLLGCSALVGFVFLFCSLFQRGWTLWSWGTFLMLYSWIMIRFVNDVYIQCSWQFHELAPGIAALSGLCFVIFAIIAGNHEPVRPCNSTGMYGFWVGASYILLLTFTILTTLLFV